MLRDSSLARRQFLRGAAALPLLASTGGLSHAAARRVQDDHEHADGHGGSMDERKYPSPAAAMLAPRETLLYLPAIYTGTPIKKPDYLATVDVDPESATYTQVIHRTPMPNLNDELHHFGWNACSSCYGHEGMPRRYLIVPGLASGRIHMLDTADPQRPQLVKVLEGDEIKRRLGLSYPHTVHCLGDGTIMISMLGDADGNAPGGFLMLDQQLNILGRYSDDERRMKFSYDFWYQPRLNTMVSSEWAAPNTVKQGFRPEDVAAGKYGQRLHFWNWQEKRLDKSIDLGEQGQIPLEVHFHHNPESPHGFVGAALSSAMWHFFQGQDGNWEAERVIQVDPVEVDGWPFPVPGLITDLVISLDDRFLYFSNWLHGDIRQYDISDPAHPRLTGQVWLGGILERGGQVQGQALTGGPQMLQLSLDGRRLYVSNSLYSVWDDQFYPDIAQQGSYIAQIDCNTEQGGMQLNEDFLVDFGKEPDGPARAHEIRFPGGDSTSDIWG